MEISVCGQRPTGRGVEEVGLRVCVKRAASLSLFVARVLQGDACTMYHTVHILHVLYGTAG